jgi:hypothetical protein
VLNNQIRTNAQKQLPSIINRKEAAIILAGLSSVSASTKQERTNKMITDSSSKAKKPKGDTEPTSSLQNLTSYPALLSLIHTSIIWITVKPDIIVKGVKSLTM